MEIRHAQTRHNSFVMQHIRRLYSRIIITALDCRKPSYR